MTRLSIVFAFAIALSPACALGPSSQAEPPVINGPFIIGFFPPLSTAEFEDPDSGNGQALEHLEIALSKVEECLTSISPEVRLELTYQLRFWLNGRLVTIDVPREPDRSFGAYLIKPGSEPRVVYPTMGGSSLLQFIPDAAAEYFGVPGCRFQLGQTRPPPNTPLHLPAAGFRQARVAPPQAFVVLCARGRK